MLYYSALDALQAWLYFILLVYNYWVQVRHVPYYHTWINCAFAFSTCTYAWGAFLLLIATYVRDHWDRFTIAFYCGAVLSVASMGFVGFRCALLCRWSLSLLHMLCTTRCHAFSLILELLHSFASDTQLTTTSTSCLGKKQHIMKRDQWQSCEHAGSSSSAFLQTEWVTGPQS